MMNEVLRKMNLVGVCIVGVFCAGVVFAAENKTANSRVALLGEEIQELLAGNSAVYESGAKQFFGADGNTLYHVSGKYAEKGTWRVSENRYCSRWQFAGRPGYETCYTMERENKRITWNEKYPATIQKGDVFALPAKSE